MPLLLRSRAMEQAQPVCLRCGRSGCPGVTDSVRASGGCTGEYSKPDLAAVRCYVCGRKGHLCCAKVPASTYRCGALSCVLRISCVTVRHYIATLCEAEDPRMSSMLTGRLATIAGKVDTRQMSAGASGRPWCATSSSQR